MKSLKMNFLLPVAVFMIAIAAAFASQDDGQEEFALEQGYIYSNNVCVPQGKCGNILGDVCTHPTKGQIFGKNGPTDCFRTLYMPWQN